MTQDRNTPRATPGEGATTPTQCPACAGSTFPDHVSTTGQAWCNKHGAVPAPAVEAEEGQSTDEGWTKKGQQQEPELSRDATGVLSDAELFDGLLRHYAAVDFADEQFPGQTVLKFAFPHGASVGADLRATLTRLAASEPAMWWPDPADRMAAIERIAERKQSGINAAASRMLAEPTSLTPEEREQYVWWAWRNPNTAREAGTLRLLAALAAMESES